MSSRTLRLRKELLAELTSDELGTVAGASGRPCNTADTVYCDTMVTYSLVLSGCMCTGYYETLNMPCDSNRICLADSIPC